MPMSQHSSNIAVSNPRSVIKREDGFLAYWFSAQLANWCVRFSNRFLPWVTPNVYTSLSLVLGAGAALCFLQAEPGSFAWGVLLLHISFIFDCADGQLARLRGIKSHRGAWFDYHSDKIKDGFLLLALGVATFQLFDNAQWVWVIAFLGIYFQFFRNINALNRDIVTLEVEGNKDTPRALVQTTDQSSQLLRTIKHSLLFKLSDRVLLYTIAGLGFALTEEPWFLAAGLIAYAFLAFVFSSLSGLLNYRVFAAFDRK